MTITNDRNTECNSMPFLFHCFAVIITNHQVTPSFKLCVQLIKNLIADLNLAISERSYRIQYSPPSVQLQNYFLTFIFLSSLSVKCLECAKTSCNIKMAPVSVYKQVNQRLSERDLECGNFDTSLLIY